MSLVAQYLSRNIVAAQVMNGQCQMVVDKYYTP